MSDASGDAVAGLPFTERRVVRFQEVDAAGVVFFARYLEWMHDAYSQWLASRGMALETVLAAGELGLPLVHAEADYRAPSRLGDEVLVTVTSTEPSEKTVTVRYVVTGPDASDVRARGVTVHAVMDRRTRRAVPMPDAWRAVFRSG